MLFNTSQQIPNNLERYDVCIVGSGPAGITLAREISRGGFESACWNPADKNRREDAQNLNAGPSIQFTVMRSKLLREGRQSAVWWHRQSLESQGSW